MNCKHYRRVGFSPPTIAIPQAWGGLQPTDHPQGISANPT